MLRRLIRCTALFLPLTVLLAAVWPATPAPAAAEATVLSPDLAGHWAARAVARMLAQGVFTGFPDGTFRPNDPVTRAQFAALAARLRGLPPVEGSGSPMLGVPSDHWGAPVIRAALQAGWIRAAEYPRGFDPDGPIARGEMARMLARAMGWDQPAAAGVQGRLTRFADLPAGEDGRLIAALVARGMIAGFDDNTFRPAGSTTRAQAAVLMLRALDPAERLGDWREDWTYTVDGKEVKVRLVRVNLRRGYRPQVMLAGGRVGLTETLAGMAARHQAVAAINGTYFNAYSPPPEPYGHIMTGGRLVHFGGLRGSVGFTADGQVVIDRLEIRKFDGTIDGRADWPHNWYFYFMNRTPEGKDWAYLYTSARGENMGFEGPYVVVQGGTVTRKGFGNPAIPPDGYVLSAGGADGYLMDRFQVGQRVDWQFTWTNPAFAGVTELLGAGPLLVRDGRVAIDTALEGFTEAKVTTQAAARSSIGVTGDGMLVMLISPSATIQQLARIWIDLGARAATALDSGGSAGLWYGGKYVWEPGRQLANGLAILPPGQAAPPPGLSFVRRDLRIEISSHSGLQR